VLLTDKYLSKIKDKSKLKELFHWEELRTGKEVYEYMGEISYHYISLDEMKFMADVPLIEALKIKNTKKA
jgi:hypothetical protein